MNRLYFSISYSLGNSLWVSTATAIDVCTSILVFLKERIQSRNRACAAQDSKKFISETKYTLRHGAGLPKRGKQPLLRLCESFYFWVELSTPLPLCYFCLRWGIPSSLLVPKVVSQGISVNLLIFHDLFEKLIKNGPEKQDLYSGKWDGFSLSPAFFLFLMTYLDLSVPLSKQGIWAPSESSCKEPPNWN